MRCAGRKVSHLNAKVVALDLLNMTPAQIEAVRERFRDRVDGSRRGCLVNAHREDHVFFS